MRDLPKLYAVQPGGPSYKAIRRFLKMTEAAKAARAQFILREFPGWYRKPGYLYGALTSLTSSTWSIRPPTDKQGVYISMPDGWTKVRNWFGFRPTLRTIRGRALRAEMESPRYVAPTKRELVSWLGMGESHWLVELEQVNSRRFVLALSGGTKPPADCKRISDVEFERIQSRYGKAVAS